MKICRTEALLICLVTLAPQWSAAEESAKQSRFGGVDFEAVEVVENVWHVATDGGLLTSDGWQHASGFFTNPSSFPSTSSFAVVSNTYWVSNVELKKNVVEVVIESAELGRIDPALRFQAASASHNPDSYTYQLIFGPTPVRWYGPDGKTLAKETMNGPKKWRIEGSLSRRWTTVNTAIRYVMDAHDRSTDLRMRENGEKTIKILRSYKMTSRKY
jgi:hypothetical protein